MKEHEVKGKKKSRRKGDIKLTQEASTKSNSKEEDDENDENESCKSAEESNTVNKEKVGMKQKREMIESPISFNSDERLSSVAFKKRARKGEVMIDAQASVASTVDEENPPENVERQIRIGVCPLHAYPTNVVCSNVLVLPPTCVYKCP